MLKELQSNGEHLKKNKYSIENSQIEY